MRVRAPDVELEIDATLLEAQPVIRDVRPEIRRIAVRADDDPALLALAVEGARLGRLEPHRAVAVDETASAPQLIHRLREVAGFEERRLLEPGVEGDAEFLRDALRVRHDPVDRHRREHAPLLIQGERAVDVAVYVLDLCGDVLHVVAGVGVRWDLDLLAVELAVTDGDRFTEALHLRAAVFDVVLALHVRAGELQHRREHVAQRTATRVRERERAGGVRRYEFDLDALAPERGRAPVVGALADDRVDLPAQPGDVETHVHESAAGDLRRGERRAQIELLLDRRRDLVRRLPQHPGETLRHARRVVTLLGVRGHLDLDLLALPPLPTVLARGASERVRECGGDEITRWCGHVRESGAVIATAPTSPLGSCRRKNMKIITPAAA